MPLTRVRRVRALFISVGCHARNQTDRIMTRSSLIGCIAVFAISLAGFKFLEDQGGVLGLIHSACFMGLFFSGTGLGVALVGGLLEFFISHRVDRTKYYCGRCGEELFPPKGMLWSQCVSWECGNCRAWGDDKTSTIEISPLCFFPSAKTLLKNVEYLRRDWREESESKRQKN